LKKKQESTAIADKRSDTLRKSFVVSLRTAPLLLSLDFISLADRTNGRAYATVLCPPVVCNVGLCIATKRCVLPKNYLKKQIGL